MPSLDCDLLRSCGALPLMPDWRAPPATLGPLGCATAGRGGNTWAETRGVNRTWFRLRSAVLGRKTTGSGKRGKSNAPKATVGAVLAVVAVIPGTTISTSAGRSGWRIARDTGSLGSSTCWFKDHPPSDRTLGLRDAS